MIVILAVAVILLLGLTIGFTIALACIFKWIMPGFHTISYLAIAFVIAFSIIFLTTFWLLMWLPRHYGFGA